MGLGAAQVKVGDKASDATERQSVPQWQRCYPAAQDQINSACRNGRQQPSQDVAPRIGEQRPDEWSRGREGIIHVGARTHSSEVINQEEHCHTNKAQVETTLPVEQASKVPSRPLSSSVAQQESSAGEAEDQEECRLFII